MGWRQSSIILQRLNKDISLCYQFMLSVYVTKSVAYHSWHFCNTNLIMVECKHTRYNHVQIMWHQEISFVESPYPTGLPSAHGCATRSIYTISCPLMYFFLQLFYIHIQYWLAGVDWLLLASSKSICCNEQTILYLLSVVCFCLHYKLIKLCEVHSIVLQVDMLLK